MPIGHVVPDTTVRPHALGLNLMIGNSGFGGGIFYRRLLTDRLSLVASFSISEAKASNEVTEYIYDPFAPGGVLKYVPGKVNQLWVVPVMFGVQYRLFKDQIANSLRPYLMAGIGPSVIFAAPYEQPLSYSLSHGRGYLGGGGYIGVGAFFGTNPNSLMGISLRYYILPMSKSYGIESLLNQPMANFNSFFISFDIATQY